ncbi:MAG: class I adenylate-forming enzyme family protein [Alphaproteobacteria bacterium]
MQAPFSRTAFELLIERAAIAPDHPIAITVDDIVTYGAMATRAAAVAGKLAADGVRRGDKIGLLSNNRSEWLEVYFGAAAIGAIIAPFSTWSTVPELEFLLNDAEVHTLFTLGTFGGHKFADGIATLQAAGALPHLRNTVLIDGDDFGAYRNAEPLAVQAPGDGASAADRVLISIPLFWSYGAVNALMAAVSHGATMVLQGRFEPGGALDLIERDQCTSIYTLPAMTNALLAHPDFKPERTKSLRTGATIGAPQDLIRAAEGLGAHAICNIYGQTEGYGNCCVTPHDWPLEQRAACQGPPLPGVTVRICNPETGAIEPTGTIGDIEITGYLSPGYAGLSAEFNSAVYTDDGYFKTGDLGSLLDNGAIVYAGRSSEMIKRSGINVSPAEVEEALQQSSDIGLAGVAGVPDDDKGEIIVAFVVCRPGIQTDADALKLHCRTLLSSYKLPDRIYFREDLPLTPTGKLMRRELTVLAKAAVVGE